MILPLMLVLFTICYCHSIESPKKFESLHKQIQCRKIDKVLFENGTCTYKQLNWKTAKFCSDFNLKPNVQITNIMYKGTLFRRGTNMEYRIFGPAEYSIDVCAFLNGTFTHILAQWLNIYIKTISKDNNVFHPCPFSGHVYLHDLIFHENSYALAGFVPNGDYILRSRVFTLYNKTERLLMEVNSYTQIKSL